MKILKVKDLMKILEVQDPDSNVKVDVIGYMDGLILNGAYSEYNIVSNGNLYDHNPDPVLETELILIVK